MIELLVSIGPDGAGVSEIARALSINKSTCYGILNTLVSFQVLSKHPRFAIYHLGPRLVEWGTATRRQLSTNGTIRRRINELVKEFGLTCLVGQILADNRGVVVVDRIEPARKNVSTLPVGQVVPLTGPAMGRIVLSYLDDSEAFGVAERLGLVRRRSESAYAAELRAIRERGFATSVGEYNPDVNAVAAAVTRANTEILVILCVVGFRRHLPAQRLEQVGRRLASVARELEHDERLRDKS